MNSLETGRGIVAAEYSKVFQLMFRSDAVDVDFYDFSTFNIKVGTILDRYSKNAKQKFDYYEFVR